MIRFGAKVWILTASLLALIGLATDKASATQIGPNLVSPYEYGSDCATTVLVTYTAFPFPETGNVDFLASYNQPSSPCGAPGQQFTALQLRPAVGGGYTVVAEQPFTTSATTGPVQYTLAAPWHVQAGDIYAHLGQGIPIDIFSPNPLLNPPDPLYIASHVPVVGETITLGSGNFSTYPQSRDYYLVANFTPQAHVCVSPPSGMVGWWPGDGNANDIVGSNNGTLVGGVTFAPGEVGQAFDFNNGEVDVPHNSNQNMGSQITIDAWVFPRSSGHGRTIAQKRSSGNVGGYTFETTNSPYGPDNGLQFVIWIGGILKYLVTPANTLTIGTWQHVAATYDGTTMRIYVNGVEKANTPVSGAIDAVTSPFVMGRNVPTTSFAWDGLIDEVELFNRALSPAEILSIFNAGSAGKCKTPPTCVTPPSGMVGWWPGDGNANDIIGTNNGTLQGGVTFAPGKVAQAFMFDGVSGDVQVQSDPSLNIGTQWFLDFWINPGAYPPGPADIVLVNKWVSGLEDKDIVLDSTGKIAVVLFVGGTTYVTSPPALFSTSALPLNTWSFVAVTYNGSAVKIYINGVLDASAPATGSVANSNGKLYFGHNFDRSRLESLELFFKGLLDEIEWATTVPTDAQILSIFNADTAGKCKNLSPPGPQPTTLSFTGVSATTSDFDDPATVQAKLTKTSDGSPVPSEMTTFTLGSGSGAPTCSATTDATGTAACSLTPNQPAGPQTLAADFAGDSTFGPSSTSTTFTVTKEETVTKFTATSPTLLASGMPATFSATLKEDGVTPISGRTLTFTLGSGAGAQSCSGASDASGTASCSIVVNQPLGPNTIKVDFASDSFFRPSSDTEAVLLFAFLGGGGSFVIGDLNAVPGNAVTFWGAQWAKVNSLSGGPAPNAFKGFADQISTTPPACGGTFMTDPGNSAPPPASVPAFMAVIDSSSISKSGSTISGNIPGIVIVKTNPGYAPDPGHAGTGTVVARLCGS